MAILSTKGQIVIPDEIRDRMDFKPGDEFTVNRLDERNVLLTKMPEDPVRAMRGMFKGLFKGDSVAIVREMRDKDRKKTRRKQWYD
jgi:AbrB family looped-hinge helix DNA binding protein